MIKYVRKRDGSLAKFDEKRIRSAIYRALFEFGKANKKLAARLTKKVISRIKEEIPTVEHIQDVVEQVLREYDKRIADAYHEYRQTKAKIRELKEKYGIKDKLKLTYNSLVVLKERYLLKDESGRIIETPTGMFKRVATAIAKVDKKYGQDWKKSRDSFFGIMSRLEFLPNSPTLFNAGAPLKQLSACFVLPVEDSLKSIFETVKLTALIEQTGGGVGFNFSHLRPKGDIVRSTKGVASGPVSFMRVFDVTTEVIKAGGKRRGAMMGILNADHPDIFEFVNSKLNGTLQNFNISVGASDEFVKAAMRNDDFELINPRTGEVVRRIDAGTLWQRIVNNAWRIGDPGMIFLDEINRHNPIEGTVIEATNPCGELPLLPYESCNLGSINLTKFVKGKRFDWERLAETVRLAVHFLDNVIDANVFPDKRIEKATKANRKIGLGVMGWAEALILLGIRYDSWKAIRLAERLMHFISRVAREKSEELGEERGNFPNFERSIWKDHDAMRNATVTSIAPTGSISIIAGCSSSIEPLFAVAFVRNVLGGKKLLEINPVFEYIAKKRGFYSAELMDKISKKGTVTGIDEVPEDVQKLFRTALEIAPEWHVRMQAAFQKYVDNAVSKTVNLPQNATPSDVDEVYKLAFKLKCKGITVFRYGSRRQQVLYLGKRVEAHAEYSGGCPTGVCPL